MKRFRNNFGTRNLGAICHESLLELWQFAQRLDRLPLWDAWNAAHELAAAALAKRG